MIRVLIERHFVEGMEDQLRNAERVARTNAMQSPGYISGESLRNMSDPHHNIVISTWRTREDWQNWANSDARKNLMAEMTGLLVEPEKITVFESL